MEFHLPIPKLDKSGVLLQLWKSFCHRFEYYQRVCTSQESTVSATSSLLLFAAHGQISKVNKALQSLDIDGAKLNIILRVVEKFCLPYFILLFERFRYFTLVQDSSGEIKDLASVLRKQVEICEFGDLINISTDSLVSTETLNMDTSIKKQLPCQPFKGSEGLLSDIQSIGSPCKESEFLIKGDNQCSTDALQYCTNSARREDHLSVGLESCTEQISSPAQRNKKAIVDRTFSKALKTDRTVRSKLISARERKGDPKVKQSLKKKEPSVARKSSGKDKNFSCFLCRKKFKGKKCFERHVLTKHGDCKELICNHCKESFKNATEFTKHCQLYGLKPTAVKQPKPEMSKQSHSAREIHLYQCDYCSKTYFKEKYFKKHVMESHPECTSYLCWNCQIILPDLQSYKLHCDTHILKSRFSCELCQKQHHSITRLIGHLKNHLISRLKCDICGMVFSKLRYVEKHRVKHVNEPSYKCQLCGKNFLTNLRLDYHMKRHAGEKRYTCELCGKSFSQKMSFTYHKFWHKGMKPFACDICGQQYRSPGDLNRHKGKHSNKLTHVCELCGKGFRYSSSLIEHKKGHSDVRSYQCDVCFKTFIYRSGLRNHIRESRCPVLVLGEKSQEK